MLSRTKGNVISGQKIAIMNPAQISSSNTLLHREFLVNGTNLTISTHMIFHVNTDGHQREVPIHLMNIRFKENSEFSDDTFICVNFVTGEKQYEEEERKKKTLFKSFLHCSWSLLDQHKPLHQQVVANHLEKRTQKIMVSFVNSQTF